MTALRPPEWPDPMVPLAIVAVGLALVAIDLIILAAIGAF